MDKITPARRSANMAKIKGRDTKPELIVRRLIHSMGYRYRLHGKDLPGKPDLVFRSKMAVIYVHGCFWHQHADPNCKNSVLPKSRPEFWHPKLEKNVARDVRNILEIEQQGYRVLVVWECEIDKTATLKERLIKFLSSEEPSITAN